MTTELKTLPVEVAEALALGKQFLGYTLGKKAISGRKDNAVKKIKAQTEYDSAKQDVEKAQGELAEVVNQIGSQLNEYLDSGADVRQAVARLLTVKTEKVKVCESMTAQIEAINKQIAEARNPFNEKLKPLNQAIRFLVDKAMPQAYARIEGHPVTPVEKVGTEILQAMIAAKEKTKITKTSTKGKNKKSKAKA